MAVLKNATTPLINIEHFSAINGSGGLELSIIYFASITILTF